MKFKIFLTTLIIVFFNIIPVQACPPKAENFLGYQRRDNNRCEGIRQRQGISGSFALISLTNHNLKNYGSTLSIKVPNINNKKPEIKIQSRNKGYLLDNFNPRLNNAWFTFSWNTNILKQANIPPNNLQAVATISGTQSIYIPVILEKSSSQYEFIFWTSQRAIIKTFEIRNSQNQTIYKTSRSNPSVGEIKFTWNGRNAKRGRYILRVVAEIQQRNQKPETTTQLIPFEHNPDWLK